jgi:RNA ligase (TIGR02306 family)
MRKLASVQKIWDIQPIEGADRIEVVSILGWKVVCRKGQFQKYDDAVYFEIDSLIPEKDWSRFLFKPEDLGKGKHYRLKSVKLKRQLSQGLVVPINEVDPSLVGSPVGMDLTPILGIEKYEPVIPAQLQGKIEGSFPAFLMQRSDEERVQSNPHLASEIVGKEAYAATKIDGTSGSFINHEKVYVCSRNLALKEDSGNAYWQIYHRYIAPIFAKVPNVGIQGEIFGVGCQGNKLKIEGLDFAVFNVFDLNTRKYYTLDKQLAFCAEHGLLHVPIIWRGVFTEEMAQIDYLLKMAQGNYAGTNNPREGIVVRPVVPDYASNGERLSFKVINNDFLLKGGD